MILGLVDEAVAGGARQAKACELLGLEARTMQRWRRCGIGDDGRAGPKTAPSNKLTVAEKERVLQVANRPEFRDLSPKQIVPKLADQGKYVASESSFYRVLREADQLKHREPSAPPTSRHRPTEHVATAPNQVWSWDISYLASPIRGLFFYLYLVVDVWSRKIVGSTVEADESGEHASSLIDSAAIAENVARDQLALHSDNGSPMKGGTLLATLQRLGIMPSFSRPQVSNDNPFSEALFRTVKYRPEYPNGPFASLDAARDWAAWFVQWYNTEHQHSSIRFVTPADRHHGRDAAILARRHAVFQAARARHPERWSGKTRNWSPVEEVRLNPDPNKARLEAA